MPPGSSPQAPGAVVSSTSRRILLAFSHPGYRRFWGHVTFNGAGRVLESMTVGWLVLEVTDSAFWVGAAAGARGFGSVAMAPIGGLIADKMDRRLLLILIQAARVAIGVTLGMLVLTGHIALWHILLFAVLQGVLMNMNLPARNALTLDLVGREALLNAMAANMAAMNLMRVLSPLAGGYVMGAVGIAGGFFLMAGADVLGVVFMLMLGKQPRRATLHEPVWRTIREGLRYSLGRGPIRSLLGLSLLMETFAFSYHTMLPVIARDVLGVGSLGLGFLMAAGGFGAFLGTVTVASLGDFRHKGWLLVGTAAGFGVFLILFAFSHWFFLSLALVALAGSMSMSYDSIMTTLLQMLSPDEMRGRVLGLHASTLGFSTLGGLQTGAIASAVSAPFAVGLGGAIALAYALWTARRAPRLQSAEAGPARPVVARAGPPKDGS
ncbi:MAG: MFS transporter [Chloroflexota bacterium]|nr:MFS transporter [Chloroflexota bacterium]